MMGMNRRTGQPLAGNEHLAQSIEDILTTPLGSRVMRRDYGALVFKFIDQPANLFNRMRLKAAIVDALLRFEPRVIISRLVVNVNSQGQSFVYISGVNTETGAGVALNGIALKREAP